MFTLHDKNYLYIVDYHCKFPVIKKMEDLSADSLTVACKITFAGFGPPKIMSDSGDNFIKNKFKTFGRILNIEQAFSSSYHHQSDGQVEACIKLIRHAQKCLDTKCDPHIAYIADQINTTRATLLFNCLIRGIMPIVNRPPIGLNNVDEHYEALIKRQMKNDKNHDTPRIYASIPIGSTVVAQHKDGELWTHGTVESKGNHNHNGMAYTIQVMKTGQMITSKSKHVKKTQITPEQYLQDRLDKHVVTDPVEDILRQSEKQTHTNHTYTKSK